MDSEEKVLSIIRHHLFEYVQGIRDFILHTTSKQYREGVEKTLRGKVPYHIVELKHNINIFFGDESPVNVAKTFPDRMNEYSPQQDAMLRLLLGMDKKEACQRYLGKCEGLSKKLGIEDS